MWPKIRDANVQTSTGLEIGAFDAGRPDDKKKKGAHLLLIALAQTDQVLDCASAAPAMSTDSSQRPYRALCAYRGAMPASGKVEASTIRHARCFELKPSSIDSLLGAKFAHLRCRSNALPFSKKWSKADESMRPMAGGLGYARPAAFAEVGGTPAIGSSSSARPMPEQSSHSTRSGFQPIEYGYEFKVIVTNNKTNPRKVVLFHEGRGSQEGIFAELKTHCQMGYVPVKTRVGNQLYMFAGILAHNLTRELQMRLSPRARRTTAKRAALWCFREIETLRRTLIQRAGRIIRPAGKAILSMNSNERLEGELRHALATLNAGA